MLEYTYAEPFTVDEALRSMFDDESFESLDSPIRAMIVADATRAYYESGDSLPQYVANIGKSNVESYAKTLVAGYSVHGVQS